MGSGRGVGDERFGAAKADREPQQAKRVEKAERLRFAAVERERKGRSGSAALAVEEGAFGGTLGEETEIGNARHLG